MQEKIVKAWTQDLEDFNSDVSYNMDHDDLGVKNGKSGFQTDQAHKRVILLRKFSSGYRGKFLSTTRNG